MLVQALIKSMRSPQNSLCSLIEWKPSGPFALFTYNNPLGNQLICLINYYASSWKVSKDIKALVIMLIVLTPLSIMTSL